MKTVYRVWGHYGENLEARKLVRQTAHFNVFLKRIAGEMVEEKEAIRAYNRYYDSKAEALKVQKANLEKHLNSMLASVAIVSQKIAEAAAAIATEEAAEVIAKEHRLLEAYQEGQTWAVEEMVARRQAKEVAK